MVNYIQINHPDYFKSGIRVFLLCSRYKDGITKQRRILKISKNESDFDKVLESLKSIMVANERIYVTAAERNLTRAIFLFKQRQLNAEYSTDLENFYLNVEPRFISCLCDKTAVVKSGKMWMFDCDEEQQYYSVAKQLDFLGVSSYLYRTKNGIHVICSPFNRTMLSNENNKILHDNPLMLWGYSI